MKTNFLKNLFIQDEPEQATSTQPQTQVTSVPTPPTVQSVETNSTPVDTSKTKALLRDALEQESSKEFDYLKYKKSLDAMKDLIPDEKTRFISSYITAKTLGLSKEKLINTAEKSLKTLEKELNKFEEMVASSLKETVGSGQDRIKAVGDLITQKAVDLQRISEEITNLQKQKTDMEFQISKDQNKIDSLKREFTLSYNEITNDIKSDIGKIAAYLEVQ